MKLKILLIISFLLLSVNLFATDHIVITSNYTNTQESFSYYNNSSSAGGVFDVENKGYLSSSCWVSFYNNTARSGGAILVNSGGRLSLLNGSRFQNNISLSVGGAIYACANTQLYNCNFVSNRAEAGGAIYGESNLSINGCAYFSSNKAIDSGVIYYGACGGAIFIQAGEIVINPNDPVSEFVLNSSKYGGAIYNNSGTLSILDGINFSQNSSSDKGGAIYNKKIVNLMARTRNIQFTGNTANGVSNAIHDNKGTINLWASDNASIIFNDRITSEDTTSNLNINSSTTTITATGKIILNEDMSGYIGKVNLYNGQIELKDGKSFFNTENFKIYGGTLTANASNILKNFENNGIVNFISGTNNNWIKGTGTTTIDGEVINSSTIVNNVIINSGKKLTTNATNLEGQIENNGILNFTQGINNNEIIGIGNLLISGNITNDNNINQSSVTITGSLENNNDICSNKFILKQNGIVNNNGNITTDTLLIDENAEFNIGTSIENLTILENIENNGSLIFNGGTNNNVITGTGLTQVSNDVINQANITQNNLELLANKQLTNSTATITVNELLTINNNAKIINDGKLIISGGTNNGTIEQAINTSTTTINGNFVNNGTIKQNKLNIESTGKLTTNANNVETTNDLITNNGILEYTNGTNENKIEGLGNLLISGNVINNNTINQSSITIAGTLNNNNKINAKLKILGQMTTSANNINGNIENNGRLIFDSGINNNTITGTGIIEISSNIVNNSTINQDTIKINNELINNSQITAKNIYITGQFKLGQTGNFYNATNSTLYNGTSIDLQNNKIQQHNFGNLTINSGIVNLSIDVDLKEKTIDTISATKFTGNGKINVKNINIIEDAKVSENILLSFADNNLKNKVETDIKTAYTSLYKYSVDYDNSTGNFNFFRFSDDIIDNPIAFENTVSNQIGAYITQVNVIEQALTNIDSQINVIRHSKNNRNLYASNSNVIFKEKNSIEQGLWLRPYAVSETITVDDTDIKNDAYGTVGGLDLQIANSILASFYIGYATSKQSYEEININQSGYLLGLTGSYITENYYLALTANVIFNKADAQNMFGTDNIENNSYTLAGKTGIDVKLGSKLTLQPNLLLMYSMINTADYVNSQNKKITSDTATNLHIEPSLKLMLNLENQFTPYAIVSMAFNSNSSKVMMEDIVLPEKEIGSYSDLGIGFEKNWNSWNLYLQGTGRFGARQGFGVFGGLKYKFGKANDKISKQLKEKINNKKSADDFETMQLEKQLEKEQKELEEMEKEND